MGIDVYVMKFLGHVREEHGPFGRTFLLGRQGIHLPARHKPIANEIVRSHRIGVALPRSAERNFTLKDFFKRLEQPKSFRGMHQRLKGRRLYTISMSPCHTKSRVAINTILFSMAVLLSTSSMFQWPSRIS